MSQFALLYQYDPTRIQPDTDEIPLWMALDKESKDAGINVYEAGFHAAEAGRVVTMNNGGTTVSDGSATGGGEIVAGVIVIDVPDLDTATEWSKKVPVAGGLGSVQVRPVVEWNG